MTLVWLRSLAFLGLTLALAWWLLFLLELRHGAAADPGGDEAAGPGPAAGVRWSLFFLLALLAALVLSWVEVGPQQPAQTASLVLACVAVAAAACAAAAYAAAPSGRAEQPPVGILSAASAGTALALLSCAQGALAWRWVPMAEAIGRLGTGFAGQALAVGLPLAFVSSVGLTAAACLHPDFRGARLRAAAAVLLFWAVPTSLAEWRLRSAWGYGPETLASAAGVSPAASAQAVEVAVLRPSAAGAASRWERHIQAAEGIDASPENLERLAAYLQSHGHRSVFARQALAAVRRGWLLWWDADRALEAAARRVPGRCAPDYRLALALIAAGPLTPERFALLGRLDQAAAASPEGFEDVNRSQLVFEAFSAAFARFDDEARAQYWLGRVGNLWPINDKKVEVTPLQSLRGGTISGSVLIGGRPASSVRVGLFLETTSEVTKKTTYTLSASAFPDSDGNFAFRFLGVGSYHLELQGTPEQLRGDILGSPGILALSEASPAARLGPIRIYPLGHPAGEAAAAAEEWLRAEPQGLGGLFAPVGRR